MLAGVFARGELRDPALAGEHVTVTEVRISPDLKHATAFVARLGRADVDALLPALKRAAPFLRPSSRTHSGCATRRTYRSRRTPRSTTQ